MNRNSAADLLGQYRAEGAAGQFRRVENRANHSSFDNFRDTTNQFGPSHAAFTHWKKSGIPTAEVLQSSTFGKSTRLGDSASDALNFEGPPSPPKPLGESGRNYSNSMATKLQARPNPVTWMGGAAEEPSPPARPPRDEPAAALQPTAQQQQQLDALAAAKVSFGREGNYGAPRMSDDDMSQTWSSLMRTGGLKPSAAQCMVQLPADYSQEAAPRPHGMGFAMNTIGLHPQNGGRPLRKSSKFTSDFRDPFL